MEIEPKPIEDKKKKLSTWKRPKDRQTMRHKQPAHPVKSAKNKKSLLARRMLAVNCGIVPERKEDKMEIDQIAEKSAKKSLPSKKAPASAAKDVSMLTFDYEEAKGGGVLSNRLQQQVEFYFGDSNLAQDKHLRRILKSNSPSCHFNCVSAAILATFNRIKDIMGISSQESVDVETLKAALKSALKSSKVVKVSNDGGMVSRRLPFVLKKDIDQKLNARTVYICDFPSPLTELAALFKEFKILDMRQKTVIGLDVQKVVFGSEGEVKQAKEADFKSSIRILSFEEWVHFKADLKQQENEKVEGVMKEQIKDMMNDEQESDLHLVSLEFLKDQTHFSSKEKVKQFILNQAPEIKPLHIDFHKSGDQFRAVVRLPSRVQADFFVKRTLDSKWKAEKSKPKTSARKSSSKQSTLTFGGASKDKTATASEENPASFICEVELLSGDPLEKYKSKIQKEQEHFRQYREKRLKARRQIKKNKDNRMQKKKLQNKKTKKQ